MKTKNYILIGIGIILVTVVAILFGIYIITPKETTLIELGVDNSNYCYNTKMGMVIYDTIPNRFCICDGKLISTVSYTDDEGNNLIFTKCPVHLGVLCDSSTVYCKGKITGYKFGYREGNENKEFNDLNEWEEFCNTLVDNKDCFINLNYTKSKIE